MLFLCVLRASVVKYLVLLAPLQQQRKLSCSSVSSTNQIQREFLFNNAILSQKFSYAQKFQQ